MYGEKSFYRDYENLLIKNDELSKENRKLKYNQNLLENQIQTLLKKDAEARKEIEEHQNLLKEKDFEIARVTIHSLIYVEKPVKRNYYINFLIFV